MDFRLVLVRSRGNNRMIATAFSQAVSTLVGPQRWKEWGTEQVTSNFVIANNDNARVLPPASYINYWGSPPSADVRFLHFVGTYRWHGFEYPRRSRDAIRALNRSEEHTSELQSLMRISYAVFCLKNKNQDIRRMYKAATIIS